MTNSERAKQYGISVADSQYKEFVDHPEFRGSNFDWKSSVDTVARIGANSFFMGFKRIPKNIEELRGIVTDTITVRWSELCKKDGRF